MLYTEVLVATVIDIAAKMRLLAESVLHKIIDVLNKLSKAAGFLMSC